MIWNVRGYGALAQLAVVLLVVIILMTMMPEIKETLLEIIKAIG